MTADYVFAIDWDADGDFTGTGEDVTARVLGTRSAITIRYGRDQARALAPVAPGEARFELDNTSRDYSPENSSSPLAGLVLPGREVQITATASSTDYGLFRGWLDDYDVLPRRSDRSVRITCVDQLARLRQVRVTTGLHHGLRTGAAVGRLLDAVGWPDDARDLDVGATTIPWWWVDGDDAYTALLAILDAEGPGSLVTVDGDGRIVFRDRHHRLTRAASTSVQATWRDTGTEPLFADLVYDHGWRDIINSVSYQIPVRGPSGQLATVWEMDGQRTLADGETILLTASSSTPFTGAVTPVEGTDFEVLSGAVTTGLLRTSGVSTTVTVTAVGGPATIAGMSLRAYPLTTLATVTVSAEDSTSIDRYGRRSWPSDRDPTLASLPDAIAIADLILAYRAERLPTVRVTIDGSSATRLAEALGRDLSDRVRIIDAETGLDGEVWVEQIDHDITEAGLQHRVTFGCEMVPTPADTPFTFDLSGAGFDDGTFGAQGLDDPTTVFIFDDATQGQFDVGLLGN